MNQNIISNLEEFVGKNNLIEAIAIVLQNEISCSTNTLPINKETNYNSNSSLRNQKTKQIKNNDKLRDHPTAIMIHKSCNKNGTKRSELIKQLKSQVKIKDDIEFHIDKYLLTTINSPYILLGDTYLPNRDFTPRCKKGEKYGCIPLAWFNEQKSHAISGGKEWHISAKYLDFQFKADKEGSYLSGISLKVGKNRGKNTIYNASVDRVDPNKGYIEGNVRFCTMQENCLKIDLSLSEFLEKCKMVYKYNLEDIFDNRLCNLSQEEVYKLCKIIVEHNNL